MVPIVCPFALWNRNPNFHLERLRGKEMARGLLLLSLFKADETTESQRRGISRGTSQEMRELGFSQLTGSEGGLESGGSP